MYLEDILLPIVLLLLLVYSVSDVDQVVISPFSVIQDIGTEMNAYCECVAGPMVFKWKSQILFINKYKYLLN